jgi:hypothetical protein
VWHRELDERQRCEDVDRVHALEHVERVVGECGLRARAEDARVVHEQVDLAGGRDQLAAVRVVGDVARDRDDVGSLRELRARRIERVRLTRVDDEPPPEARELARESEPQAAGSSGHDCGLHVENGKAGAGPCRNRQMVLGPSRRPSAGACVRE